MSNLKKNIGLQTIYQIIATITPLITAPYLARKLGASAIGIYSYTLSIVNYFILFAMQGFVNYGTREIATKNKNEKNRIFLEIYYLQIIFCVISMLAYVLVVLISDYKIFMICQGITLLSCFFDVTWYYFGKENFKKVIIRNIIIKVMTVIFVICGIKTSHDLLKYILIMTVSTLISQLSLWIILMKELQFKKIKIVDVIKHCKPVFILFLPILTMSIYHIMDKTMLGICSTPQQSGYYYNADKIVNIPLGILSGIGTIMLANITSILKDGKIEEAKEKIKKSIKYIVLISIILSVGIFSIASEFVPFFFGEGYEQCINMIKILSIVIIIKAFSDGIRTQYFIPFKKEKQLIISTVIGAVINFIFNFVFIYLYGMGAIGATWGTLIAEIMVCAVQIVFIRKEINFINELLFVFPYLFFSIIMSAVIMQFRIPVLSNPISLIVEIIEGGIIFSVLSFGYTMIKKDDLYRDIISKIIAKYNGYKKKGEKK